MKKKLMDKFLKLLGVIIVGIIVHLIGNPLQVKFIDSITSVYHLLINADLFDDLKITSERFLWGYLIAVISAVPLGVLLGRIQKLYKIFEIPINVLRIIPSAVVIPFGLVFLGVSTSMKLFVIWYGAFWPLIVPIIYTCRDIDPIFLEVSDIFHIGKFKTLTTVIIPAVLPTILSNMRVSLGIALLLTITVEMIAGGNPDGLGYFIIDSERSFRQNYMIAGVIVLALFGLIINFIYGKLEDYLKSTKYDYLKRQ